MNQKQKEIKEELRKIFTEVLKREVTEEQLAAGSGLTDRLHIDSLMGLQIIVKIEQRFNVIIEDDNLAIKMLDSIERAMEFIQKYDEENSVFLNRG